MTSDVIVDLRSAFGHEYEINVDSDEVIAEIH